MELTKNVILRSPRSGRLEGRYTGTSSPAQQRQHAVKLVKGRIVHGQAAAAPLWRQGDAQAERGGELRFQRHRIGVAGAARLLWLGSAAADQVFGGADVEPAAHHLDRQRRRIGRTQERAGMPGRQHALFKTAPHRRRQRQEAQRVGDMAAALADGFGNAGLAVAEFAGEAAIGLGLFERREVFALQILDKRDFERFRIAELPDDDWDLVQANPLRGAPSALGRTSKGWTMPFSRIDWASPSSSASANTRRG